MAILVTVVAIDLVMHGRDCCGQDTHALNGQGEAADVGAVPQKPVASGAGPTLRVVCDHRVEGQRHVVPQLVALADAPRAQLATDAGQTHPARGKPSGPENACCTQLMHAGVDSLRKC